VFSNATFHWVPDHDALFAALRRVMKGGGRLVAQCGGKGNIDRFRRLADEWPARSRLPPTSRIGGDRGNYADAPETAERLRRAGFIEVETWLQERPTPLDDPPRSCAPSAWSGTWTVCPAERYGRIRRCRAGPR